MTLANLLRATAQSHGHRVAIRMDDAIWTWDEYLERIARTGSMLRGLGLTPGRRFGILARNSVPQAQLLNAGYWAGVVPVPLNFRLAAPEIAQMLDDAHCDVVFVDNALAAMLDAPALARWRERAVMLPVDAPAAPGWLAFDALVADAGPMPAHESHEDDDAIVLFTGGTTGRSKGVRLTHRNVVSNALQLARVMEVDENDVYLHVSPMFHSTDLKATVVTMYGGGHTYLSDFSVEGVLRAAARHRVTILSLVPTMIVRVLREGRLAEHDLSSVRLVSYGTSPIDEGVLREAMRAFAGVGFHQCYGLTETSPLLAILDQASHRLALADRPELLRAAGRPLPGVDMRFVDDHGREVGRGEAGEIVVRGPQVSRGYLNAPEENAKAFKGGWFHTGDIGRIDADGYLHVLGRRKEMVITGGENVYTREVECVLEDHPAVAEVAVVGVPDPQYGEALLAVIVPSGAAPAPEAMIAFCRGRLGGFKIPRRYQFVAQLPRTQLGKVRKNDLVQAYLSAAEQRGVEETAT
nr:AMP-binding protein [Schlegelella koreensis]